MATFTPKRLGTGAGGITPVQLTISAATIYTVPSTTTTTIKQILISNVTASDATFTLYLVKTGGTAGATNQIYGGVKAPANTTIHLDWTQVMTTGDFISAFASTNSAVNITISGIESV